MNKTDFKPHMMYDPKTGKGVRVKTYEEHLALKKKVMVTPNLKVIRPLRLSKKE